MTTVANRKYAEMKQLEFQQSGSSSVTAMLNQPLLEKSSTWLCEVTNFEVDMGEELAFPEGETLFTIVRRPTLPAALPLPAPPYNTATHEVHIDMDQFSDYLEDLYKGDANPVDDYGIWGYLYNSVDVINPVDNVMEDQFLLAAGPLDGVSNTGGAYVWTLDADLLAAAENLDIILGVGYNRETRVISKRYYSTLDFVADIASQVSIFDRKLQGEETGVEWEEVDADQTYFVSFSVDSGGNMFFNMNAASFSYHVDAMSSFSTSSPEAFSSLERRLGEGDEY